MAGESKYIVNIPSDTKYLILHESPGEVKTVSKFLPKGYLALPTIGHFMKTNPKALEVDTGNWKQKLYVDIKKRDVLNNIKKAIEVVRKNNGKIIVAGDVDREGQVINLEVVNYFNLKKDEYVAHGDPTSLVEREYMKGVLNPKEDYDTKLAEAGVARQILDKYIGFEVTQHLWSISGGHYKPFLYSIEKKIFDKVEEFESKNKDVLENNENVVRGIQKFKDLKFNQLENFKNRMGISFGRVQIASLILLVQKELEVLNKGLERKVNIQANDSNSLTWEYSKNGELETQIDLMKDIYSKLKVENISKASIVSIDSKQRKVSPPSTMGTTLAQTGLGGEFGMSVKKIMSILQSLYEEGYTTYMRTDSISVTDAMEEYIKGMIEKIGETHIHRVYQTKSANAQEGHIGILPTKEYDLKNLNKYKTELDNDKFKVFEYIVRRSVSAFMKEAIIENFTYTLEVEFKDGTKEQFILKDSNIIDEGFLKVFTYGKSKYDRKVFYNQNEEIKVVEFIFREKDIKLPGAYTETGFVKELEDNGIGRPSTIKDLIDTLKEKDYINVKNGKLEVTPKGFWVYETVTKEKDLFGQFKEVTYTATMEKALDKIAQGKISKKVLLDSIKKEVDIIKNLKPTSNDTKGVVKKVDVKVLDGEWGDCIQCGKGHIEKKEVNGKIVWSCSNWKGRCKNSIWQTVAGHIITDDEARKMLETGESDVITDFKSKKGKDFSARLVFDKKKGYQFQFDN